jgi:phosphoribosylamine--glycine ligase
MTFLNDEKLSHIPVIGPSKIGAQLEGSKEFAKEFLVNIRSQPLLDSFTADTVEKDVNSLLLKTSLY